MLSIQNGCKQRKLRKQKWIHPISVGLGILLMTCILVQNVMAAFNIPYDNTQRVIGNRINSQKLCTTELDSMVVSRTNSPATDDKIYIAGRSNNPNVINYEDTSSSCFGTKLGFLQYFQGGVLQRRPLVFLSQDLITDSISSIPWIGLSQVEKSPIRLQTFIAVYLNFQTTDYIAFVDIPTFTLKKMVGVVTSKKSDGSGSLGIDMWKSGNIGGSKEHFLFQHIQSEGASNNLDNYRVFVGYEDALTIEQKKLTIKAWSTSKLQQVAADGDFTYGVRSLCYTGKLWFGGSKETADFSGVKQIFPIIGRVNPLTLSLEMAKQIDLDLSFSIEDRYVIEMIRASEKTTEFLMVGLAVQRNSNYEGFKATPNEVRKMLILLWKDENGLPSNYPINCDIIAHLISFDNNSKQKYLKIKDAILYDFTSSDPQLQLVFAYQEFNDLQQFASGIGDGGSQNKEKIKNVSKFYQHTCVGSTFASTQGGYKQRYQEESYSCNTVDNKDCYLKEFLFSESPPYTASSYSSTPYTMKGVSAPNYQGQTNSQGSNYDHAIFIKGSYKYSFTTVNTPPARVVPTTTDLMNLFTSPQQITSSLLTAFTTPQTFDLEFTVTPGVTNPHVLEFPAFGPWSDSDPILYQLQFQNNTIDFTTYVVSDSFAQLNNSYYYTLEHNADHSKIILKVEKMSVNRDHQFTIAAKNRYQTAVSAVVRIKTTYTCKTTDADWSLSQITFQVNQGQTFEVLIPNALAVSDLVACKDVLGYLISGYPAQITWPKSPETTLTCATQTNDNCRKMTVNAVSLAPPTELQFTIQVFVRGPRTISFPAQVQIINSACSSITIAYNPSGVSTATRSTINRSNSGYLDISLNQANFRDRFVPSNSQCGVLSWSIWDKDGTGPTVHPSISLTNLNSPTQTNIRVIRTTPFIFEYRIVAQFGQTITQYLQHTIRVCGTETVTLKSQYAQKMNLIFKKLDTGDILLKYNVISVPNTILNWFELTPSNEIECIIDQYYAYTSLNPLTLRQQDGFITLSTTSLKIDMTMLKQNSETFYLEAQTTGFSFARREIVVSVCNEGALYRSANYKGIKKIYSKNSGDQLIKFIDFNPLLTSDCVKCETLSWRLLNSDLTPYTGTQITIDANKNVVVKTSTPLSKKWLILEAYYSGQCNFIFPKSIDLEITICGEEVLTLSNTTDLIFSKIVGKDGDFGFIKQDFRDMFSIDSMGQECPYNVTVTNSLSEVFESKNSTWLDFVVYDNITGDLIVKMNEPQALNVANNTELKLYVWAYTHGKKTQNKLITFNFAFAYVNKAPTFVENLNPIEVAVTEEEQIKGMKDSFQEFVLPGVTDVENDDIKIKFKPQKELPCKCLQFIQEKTKLYFQIDKSKITSKDNGTWELNFELTDNKYDASFMKNSYSLELLINLTPLKQDEVSQKFADLLMNKTEEEGVKNETKVVIEEEVFEGIFVEPYVNPLREQNIKPENEIRDAWNTFLQDFWSKQYVLNSSLPDPSIYVDEINMSGILKIKFNQELVVPDIIQHSVTVNASQASQNKTKDIGRQLLSYNEINVTRDIMEIKLKLNSLEDTEKLAFDVEIKEWTTTGMQLKLNFVDPLVVSIGIDLDEIYLKVINGYLFSSPISGKSMPDKTTLIQQVPRQAPPGVDPVVITAQAESAGSSLNILVFIRLVLQGFLKGSIEDLWTLFYTLQIICYMKYYSIQFPSNSLIYLNEFRGIIEFDILNPEKFIQSFFIEDFTFKGFISGVKEKYKNEKDFMDEMMMYIFGASCLCVFLIFMCFGYVFLSKLRKIIGERIFKIKNALLYNGIIRMITVAYIQYCMTNGRQVKKIIRGEQLSTTEYFSGVIMASTVLLFPWISFIIVKNLRHRLDQPEIKAKISNLTLDIHKYRHPRTIYYHAVFLGRRLVFVAFPTILVNFPQFQIQSLTIISLIYIMNYTEVRPHEDPRRYKLEQFNECCILLITYLVPLFAAVQDDFVFTIGWIHVSIIGLVVVVNVTVIIIKSIKLSKRQKKLLAQRTVVQSEIRIENNKTRQQLLVHELNRKLMKQIGMKYKPEKKEESFLPEIKKIKRRPFYFNEPISLKPERRLFTIAEEDSEHIKSMEDEISKEWANFGELVKETRKSLIAKLSKEKQELQLGDLIRNEPEIKESLSDLINYKMDENITFEQSKRQRWQKFYHKDFLTEQELNDGFFGRLFKQEEIEPEVDPKVDAQVGVTFNGRSLKTILFKRLNRDQKLKKNSPEVEVESDQSSSDEKETSPIAQKPNKRSIPQKPIELPPVQENADEQSEKSEDKTAREMEKYGFNFLQEQWDMEEMKKERE